jgi:hypothetical protein
MTNDSPLGNAGTHSEWASLVDILRDIGEQRIGLTEGCERVVMLRWRLGQTENDLFLPFVGVDSELHIFPTGRARERWSAGGLAREDAKRMRAEQHYRRMVLTAIEKLLPFAEKRLQSIVEADPKLKWQSVVSLLDVNVAHSLAALLEAEAVPTQVTSDSKLIGEALVWEIRVPVGMLEQANRLLAQSRFTDAELTYLATGALTIDDDSR